MRLGSLFGRAAPRDPEIVARIKEWTTLALDLPAGTVMTVSEIACPDPGCPDMETVILIMRPRDKTRAYKIARVIGEVTEPDVREALVSASEAGAQ
jgi:hypothetical protein